MSWSSGQTAGARIPKSEEETEARPSADSRRVQAPKFGKKTIALVYDFDGTLSPEAHAGLRLPAQIGIDPAAFWKESNALRPQDSADR